jgi:hypothetical protein
MAALIISASRRTDIPAFYSRWFINRIRAGYCTVPNPFNPQQVSTISLAPQDVEVIVFWTRHARPLLPFLGELDRSGYRYYFQYTLMDNPRLLDPRTPSLDVALDTFYRLADCVGPERVIWRYDPIVFSQATGASFHCERFAHIAGALRGRTRRVVISVMDLYRKTERRLRQLADQGLEVASYSGRPSARFDGLMGDLVQAACQNGMEITSCAEEIDLRPYGIRPGKCIDDEYIRRVFGLAVGARKDPTQREACGCVVSRDIGMYDSCLFGCRYCYATSSFERARLNWREHDPQSPSLLGHHDAPPPDVALRQPALPLVS